MSVARGALLALLLMITVSVALPVPQHAEAHAACHIVAAGPTTVWTHGPSHIHGDGLDHSTALAYYYTFHVPDDVGGWYETTVYDVHDFAYPIPPGWDDYYYVLAPC